MTISLLYIVVPTILVLAMLILFMNSRNKAVMKEIGELKTQLAKMDNVPVDSAPAEMQHNSSEQASMPPEKAEEKSEIEKTGEKEKKDAAGTDSTTAAASAYNTGKSGKIYTKEELELLIKE